MRRRPAALLIGCCMLFAFPTRADEVKLTRNDLTLNAALTVAPGKRLQDGAILLLHGLLASDDMEIIQSLQKLLAAHGFSSLAPTLSLGIDDRHGMYDCSVPQRHTEADADGEIGAWLGWLKDHGAPRVVLAGHSNGGTEVARYAAAHDDSAIAALVLLAPRTWTAGQGAADYERTHNMPLITELAYAQALVSSGNNDATLEDVGFLSCDHATVTAGSFLSYYGDDRTRDTPSVLPEIDAPVLVVAAGKDQVVRDLPARMQPLVDQTHVSLVTVADADHLFHDLYAEDAVEAIAKFLQDKVPR
jgi:pimeloyl-ACP methyl ester carboxylesterase